MKRKKHRRQPVATAPRSPQMSPLDWDALVTPHGPAVEEAAWGIVCQGFDGSPEELVEAAKASLVS